MGITPSNNPGTESEILRLLVENSPNIPYMAKGNPIGYGIQFQGIGILFNYLCLTWELFLQSIRPSELYEKLSFPLYLNGASSMAIPNGSHDVVKISFQL